jgi:hypothetical protein
MHGRVLLVVQREREEGKKNGCLEQPQDVFHSGASVPAF